MTNTISSRQRNYGIDLLRILAAFFVVTLHTMIQGGLENATVPESHQYYISQCLISICYCAVNLFGIISGYVNYTHDEKKYTFSGQLGSYFVLWLEVVFYNVFLTLFYIMVHPEVADYSDLLPMFTPIYSQHFWYFSAYTVLHFLIPVITTGIRYCSGQIVIPLLIIILVLFTPLESNKLVFQANNGYSFLWLLVLYIIGATLKKYRIPEKIPSSIAVIGILVIYSILIAIRCNGPVWFVLGRYVVASFTNQFTYPLHLYVAILYVILFSKLNPGKFLQKIILFSAPASFAVYLANVQYFVWEYGLHQRVTAWAGSSVPGLLGRVCGFSVFFIAVITVLDYFRRTLFRILKVQHLAHWILQPVDKMFKH